MEKTYYVYILASKKNGTLYIGITSNLIHRIHAHQNDLLDGFTHKYSVKSLVYFEITLSMHSAIKREKQLKKWRRQWKINLIETTNPDWRDLYPEITGFPPSRE